MNTAPVIVDEMIIVDENQTVTFNPLDNDSDPDGDTLQITRIFESYQNSGFATYYGGNIIEYSAYFSAFGETYDYVSYVVSDGNGAEVVGTTQIKINFVNDAPDVYFSDQYYDENQTYSLFIGSYDQEDFESPKVTLTGPDSDLFTKPDINGNYYFKTVPDFENPQDANGDNVYELTASATDSEGLTSTVSGTITVLDVGEYTITEGDDTVRGTDNYDDVSLLGGNDLFLGFGSDDYAYGMAGNDTLKGGDGSDNLFGDNGKDELKGGSGSDYLEGGIGKDRLFGGADADYLSGGEGDDLIFGGTAGDYAYGGGGDDSIYGEDGDDYLFGEDGADLIWGGNGDDYLYGFEDNDSLYGQSGADYFYGGTGNDLILGGADADYLYGEEDNDVLLGGGGNDYHFGGDGNDVIRGDKGGDHLYGEGGNDKLQGGDGNDWLDGGNGNDRLDAGSGLNYIVSGSGADTVIIGHHDGARTENDDLDFSQDVLVIRAFDGNARTVITSKAEIYALEMDGLTVSDDGNTTYLDFDLDDGTSHQVWLNGFTNIDIA